MDDNAVAQFVAITAASPAIAAQYLRLADHNIEQAMELYYANDGSALEDPSISTGNTNPPPAPPQSTQPPSHRRGYEDEAGIVHVDSDGEDEDFVEDDVEITGSTQRQAKSVGGSATTLQTRSSAAHSMAPVSKPVEDDEAMARRLQEEFYGAGADRGAEGQEIMDEQGYRAPMGRTTETLVGPGSFDPTNADDMRAAAMQQMAARRQHRARGTIVFPKYIVDLILTLAEQHGIFNQATAPSIWNADDSGSRSQREQLAQATGGASEASARSNLLAEMYRPPFELISRLPWEEARQQGREGEKWILVNIQDPSIFDCQLLNRDIWKNSSIMETVKENFLFMQYSKDDPRGNQYVQYYFQNKHNDDAYPHVAIVDPRTGEQVKVWSGPPAPKAPDFLMQLHEFLDRYSLKATAKNPVAKRKPEVRRETQVDRMTEEQMMEMAMQASMTQPEGRRGSDPDELTRSLGNAGEDSGKRLEAVSTNVNSTEAKNTNGSVRSATSRFASILSTQPHDEPPADPTTTRIQFRHPNGRIVRRFAVADPVKRLFEWLKASPIEGKEGLEFELSFLQKNLMEVLNETIEQAGLKNGTVMIEFIEG